MPRVLQERSAQLEQLGMSVFRGPRKMVVSWLQLKSKQIRGILQTKNTQFSGKWCSFWLPLKQKNNRGYHQKKKRRTHPALRSPFGALPRVAMERAAMDLIAFCHAEPADPLCSLPQAAHRFQPTPHGAIRKLDTSALASQKTERSSLAVEM